MESEGTNTPFSGVLPTVDPVKQGGGIRSAKSYVRMPFKREKNNSKKTIKNKNTNKKKNHNNEKV